MMHMSEPSKRYFRIFSQLFHRDVGGYWSHSEMGNFRIIAPASAERDYRLFWYRQVNRFWRAKIAEKFSRHTVMIVNPSYIEYFDVRELQCVLTAFQGEW